MNALQAKTLIGLLCRRFRTPVTSSTATQWANDVLDLQWDAEVLAEAVNLVPQQHNFLTFCALTEVYDECMKRRLAKEPVTDVVRALSPEQRRKSDVARSVAFDVVRQRVRPDDIEREIHRRMCG